MHHRDSIAADVWDHPDLLANRDLQDLRELMDCRVVKDQGDQWALMGLEATRGPLVQMDQWAHLDAMGHSSYYRALLVRQEILVPEI